MKDALNLKPKSIMRMLKIALVPALLCSILMGAQGYLQTRKRGTANKNSSAGTKKQLSLPDRIDQLVDAQVHKLGLPGYSLAVISGKATVIQKGYGFADAQAETPVTPGTTFGIGAVTENFTAMALVMLVDDGKIKLDSPLHIYLPDTPSAWRKVTIRQLASMTSGIPNDNNSSAPWAEELKALKKQPLVSTPGGEYLQSEASYRIIGNLIEKVSGQPYMEFVRTRILSPLGMLETSPTDRAYVPPMAVPYTKNESGQVAPLPGYEKPEVGFSASMLASNTVDLAKYATALMTHKLLSPTGYELLWKKRPPLPGGSRPGWAFGWGLETVSGHASVVMDGLAPGITSTIMIFPDDKLIVIGLSNIKALGAVDLTHRVASLALGVDAGPVDDQQ
ncbi:MAG TPA: serine hydrolase domain-containing protein [Blastocatellia bacterium]